MEVLKRIEKGSFEVVKGHRKTSGGAIQRNGIGLG